MGGAKQAKKRGVFRILACFGGLFGFIACLIVGVDSPLAMGQSKRFAGELADQAYYKRQYQKCGDLYLQAAVAAPLYESTYRYNAACCFALAGEVDAAFDALQLALDNGFRDGRLLLDDSDLRALRRFPQWGAIEAQCDAQEALNLQNHHPDLMRLNRETLIERRKLPRADAERYDQRMRRRADEVHGIIESNGITTSLDYVHSANILYHSGRLADLRVAVELGERAYEMDPALPAARMIFVATHDRYLWQVGEAQIYGSQLKKQRDGTYSLAPFNPASISDTQRLKMGLNPHEKIDLRVQKLNTTPIELPDKTDIFELRLREGR